MRFSLASYIFFDIINALNIWSLIDAKSLQDLQTKAQKLRAKGFTIDKMGRYNPPVKKEDKDAFDPITEACWTGYKQVGMKKKGDKMVPNCVPESDVNEHIRRIN